MENSLEKMVTCKEIRTGNKLLDFSGRVISVKSIGKFVECEEGNGMYLPEDLTAIPLNEERLKWFGFSLCEDKTHGLLYCTTSGWMITHDEGRFFLHYPNYLDALIELKGVHHLQNLIFDLEGREVQFRNDNNSTMAN